MFDLVIKNGLLVDGTGAPRFAADLAVKDGKIVHIGPCDGEAVQELDAQGAVVAPGFIDVHGHSDLFAFADPQRESKLAQGITTEICCQCGMGPAPVGRETYPFHKGYYESQGAPIYPGNESFLTFGAYLDYMEQLPMGINTAYFIPHGMVRMAVMGLSPAKATAQQLEAMAALVEEGMAAGAIGLSSGLMYAPGSFGDYDEFLTLCRVVGKYDGIYTSHIRDQGNLLIECVTETLDIARSAGARANISHAKASGRINWGKIATTCAMVRDAGFPATQDVYPYTAGSTIISSTLPPKYLKMGSAAFLEHIADTSNRQALEDAIFNPTEQFDNQLVSCGYEGILIATATVTSDAVGKTVAQYATGLGISPFEAYIKIMADNAMGVTYIGFSMAQEDVDYLIADPLCMFGCDALYMPGMPMTHPRAIGTFPRILGRSVREQGIITLEEAIRKMTGMAAQVYGLKGKGLLMPGMDADLVIFDPVTIVDRADYANPFQPNKGIGGVCVAGQLVFDGGAATGALPGGVLRVR